MRRIPLVGLGLGLVGLAFVACGGTNAPGRENDGVGGGGGAPSVPSERSWRRNPEHPLACARPLTANPLSSPLARLTNQQYENTLRDLFAGVVSDGLPKENELPPELRASLFTNNAQQQSSTADLIRSVEAGATAVARTAAADPAKLLACGKDIQADEAACVDAFITRFGLRAFRRPLTADELKRMKDLFRELRTDNDLGTSLETLVSGILQSPQFLYRFEEGHGPIDRDRGRALSGYEVASRLSYFLWDTMPDDALFAAAESGKLSTPAGVEAQARRMLDDDRARPVVRTFHKQWLELDRIGAMMVKKDKTVYASYTPEMAAALSEGLDRFIDDAFWGEGGTVGKLFTSKRIFVNDAVAALYDVPSPGPALAPVDADLARRVGLLTQAGLMAGLAHPTEQAPIQRGSFVLERVMCAPPPPPPSATIPTIPPLSPDEKLTYRQRVERATQEGACGGCHTVVNGVGFGFENYDGIGRFQTEEQGLPIDASGTLQETLDMDGPFENAVELANRIGKSEQVAQCVVEHWYEFAVARGRVPEDGCVIAPLTDAFVAKKGNLRELLVELTKTSAFRMRTTVTE